MSDASDVIGYIGGGSGVIGAVAVFAKYVWDSTRLRKEKLEAEAEEQRDDTMKKVLEKLSAIELDMRGLVERFGSQSSAIEEIKAKVEAHSTRIGALEIATAPKRRR